MPASGPAAIAGEELALLLQQPGELELGHAWQRPLEDPRRLAADELRRDREKEVVDEAVGLHLLVQVRPALREQGADAAPVAQVAQSVGQVDGAGMADDLDPALRLRRLRLRGGEDQHLAARGEERRLPGQVEAA